MVNEIKIKKITLHFNQHYKIAYEEVDEAEVVVVKLGISPEIFGFGNAAPDTEVTGEAISQVEKIMRERLTPDFFSEPLDKWYLYHEKIQKVFAGFPSAQSAVEEALLNLWLSYYKVPPTSLYGGYQIECPTMITIVIKDKEGTLADVKSKLELGFKIIKLKCGLDWQDDLQRIIATKRLLPNDVKLILDANQGYDFADAYKLISALKDSGIALIEQPIARQNIEGLKKLQALNFVPIVADESVVSINDALNLLLNDYVAGVNIKLMKCGGPINFIKIYHLAKSLGKIIMLGCMYETNISMTTGASLALALPIDFVDLDSGHLDFIDDPTTGGAAVKNGKISVKSLPYINNF